jgi:hypothetical protein
MTQQTLPWFFALGLLAAIALAGWWWSARRASKPRPLPSEWALTPRPVFNTDERRMYRQLREALPHHIVLAKLPLVRFCQPAEPQDVRYWYDLLGATHVTFAICSANGRVLAAIDFDNERGGSRRALQIKQAVLAACRIRYLRCPIDHLPSIPELQLLVPQAGAPARSPQAQATVAPAIPPLHDVRDALATTVASRRRQRRRPLWEDSGFFHDSFFGIDSRMDASAPSEFSPFSPPPPATATPPPTPEPTYRPTLDSDDLPLPLPRGLSAMPPADDDISPAVEPPRRYGTSSNP